MICSLKFLRFRFCLIIFIYITSIHLKENKYTISKIRENQCYTGIKINMFNNRLKIMQK